MTFALCLFASACGKRRPPLPPIERVQQRTELLSGVQQGNQVILNWPAPLRNAPNQSLQSIRRVDVFRLAQRPAAPLPLTEEEFASRATLIGSIPYEKIDVARDTLSYVDTLDLAGQPTRLRYALRYVNGSGQRAPFSNFLLIEPAARVALPPTVVIKGKELSETAITITWEPPGTNIDGSVPPNVLGYNVYRTSRSQTDTNPTPINTSLVTGTTYADKNFRFSEQYTYLVRAVSLGTEGAQVESLNSNAITLSPKDIYPPSAPGPVSIAAAPGRLSLFFPANPELDVAGYNIYRSSDPNVPRDRWVKLNAALLTRTTYQDENVESSRRYYYYVTAVDAAGNTSQQSDVVSETVP